MEDRLRPFNSFVSNLFYSQIIVYMIFFTHEEVFIFSLELFFSTIRVCFQNTTQGNVLFEF